MHEVEVPVVWASIEQHDNIYRHASISMSHKGFCLIYTYNPIFARQRCRGSEWILDPWLAEMAIIDNSPDIPITRYVFDRARYTRSQLNRYSTTCTPLTIDSRSVDKNNVYIKLKKRVFYSRYHLFFMLVYTEDFKNIWIFKILLKDICNVKRKRTNEVNPFIF